METVLITGANRGIGLELVKRFLSARHQVIATCRNPKQAAELQVMAENSLLSIHSLEVSSSEAVEKLAATLKDQVLDVVINNAGVIGGDHQSVNDMDYSSWSNTFEVNTIAPFRLITTFRQNLQKSKRPRAITISSQMGSMSRVNNGSISYRSSKAAVNKVMQVLALELKAEGIIVCPIHPGWVRTDMGGKAADISVEQSGAGLFKLIDSFTMEHSGRFWTYEGKEHPW